MGTIGIADRLSSTLFVVALAHGVVILGVTFANGPARIVMRCHH